MSLVHRERDSSEHLARLQSGSRESRPVRELECSHCVPQEAAEMVEASSEAERGLEHCLIVVILGTLGNPSANDRSHCRIGTYLSEFEQ